MQREASLLTCPPCIKSPSRIAAALWRCSSFSQVENLGWCNWEQEQTLKTQLAPELKDGKKDVRTERGEKRKREKISLLEMLLTNSVCCLIIWKQPWDSAGFSGPGKETIVWGMSAGGALSGEG